MQIVEIDTQLGVQLELDIVSLRIARSSFLGGLYLGVEDLTGTRQSRSDTKDSKLFRVVPLQEAWDLRSWTDQRHVSLENVEQLG